MKRKYDGRKRGAARAEFRRKTEAAMDTMTRKSKIKPRGSSRIKKTVKPRRVGTKGA